MVEMEMVFVKVVVVVVESARRLAARMVTPGADQMCTCPMLATV